MCNVKAQCLWIGKQNCLLHTQYMSCFPLTVENHNSCQNVCLLWGMHEHIVPNQLFITDIWLRFLCYAAHVCICRT